MAGADMTLTPEQHRIYFEARLNGQQIAATDRDVTVRCPFHDDKTASLSVHIDRGVWKCHAGCGGGGVLDFEKRFSNCDTATAWANIGELCGVRNQNLFQQKPEATYTYTDEDGALLFEKLRYPGKRFVQRTRDGGGRWIYKLENIRRVLYCLADLVRASDVMICEGEKDADRVNSLKLSGHPSAQSSRVVATTNFDGAGKWRPEYQARCDFPRQRFAWEKSRPPGCCFGLAVCPGRADRGVAGASRARGRFRLDSRPATVAIELRDRSRVGLWGYNNLSVALARN
jgi:hypothetical protein